MGSNQFDITHPAQPFHIQARRLVKTYQQGRLQVEALRGIDLDIPAGAFAVIFGPSGGGKSTLLNLLGGIDRPTSGQIRVDGLRLETASEEQLTRFRRKQVGFIFQFYNLFPSLDALDNVCLPLLARGLPRKAARRQAQTALEQVGLIQRQSHKPAELSGGEQQRVAIARAMVGQPGLVLADEPTGDLDADSTELVMRLMVELNRSVGTTFIIATHNERLRHFAGLVIDLYDGLLQVSCLENGA